MNEKNNLTDEELEALLCANQRDDFFLYSHKEGLKNREIYIDEEIGEDFFATVVIPFIHMDNDGTGKPIKVLINSSGGNIMDGMVFCNLIDNAKTPVTIEIVGFAYSMAGYIAMAGANNPNVTRVCHPFSFGLIHAGSVGYSGDARKAKQVQQFYDKIDDLVKKYILSHTKITEEQYQEKIDVEWYMLADEMLEVGMVDKII